MKTRVTKEERDELLAIHRDDLGHGIDPESVVGCSLKRGLLIRLVQDSETLKTIEPKEIEEVAKELRFIEKSWRELGQDDTADHYASMAARLERAIGKESS